MINTTTPRHILVIDDSQDAAERIKRLYPEATVIPAYNGITGLDYARTMPTIDIVILDINMPHNGIKVARQLREINRTLRILPFSDATAKDGVLQEIGCAPIVAKYASDLLLRAAITTALTMRLPILPDTHLMEHYFDEASQAEQDMREQLTQTAAILASNRSLIAMIETTLNDVRTTVVSKTTHPRVLATYLDVLPTRYLVADTSIQQAAMELAKTYKIPLLIIGLSLADAYSAQVYKPNAIIYDTTPKTMHAALSALQHSESYHDPILITALTPFEFRHGQDKLIPYLLRGWSHEDTSRAMNLTLPTIRNYKSEIFRKLNVTDVGQLRDAINHLLNEA